MNDYDDLLRYRGWPEPGRRVYAHDLLRKGVTVTSPIVLFVWAGWTARSTDLVKDGWRIAVRERRTEDIYDSHLDFIITHPHLGVSAVSQPLPIVNMEYHRRQGPDIHFPLAVHMEMGREVRLHMAHTPHWDRGFEALDAEPQMVEFEDRNLSSLPIFRTWPKTETNLILDKLSLDEVLALARKKQQPVEKQYAEFKYNQELLRKHSTPAAILRVA